MRFCRRHRGYLIAGGAAAVLAVVLALVIPAPRDSKRDADVNAATVAPTLEASVEAAVEQVAPVQTAYAPALGISSSSDYPTDFTILDGIPQTDRPLGLPEGAQVDDSYFDGAVFVGDSVSLKLRQYVVKQRSGKYPNMLGAAQFLTTGSFSSHEAISPVTEKSLHPTIDGVKMTLEDALVKMGATKVFIMLGMNDVAHVGIEKSVNNMGTLLSRIREKLPNAQIFVQSATPRYSGKAPTTQSLFNYDIELYKQLAQLKPEGIYFLDIAYIMRDEEGKLRSSYCSDKEGMAMHFTDTACLEWVKYLYTHTPAGVA